MKTRLTIILALTICLLGYNSTLLDAWAADNGYELRRYQSDADLTLVEDWAKMLVETGKKESPCVVLAKDGRVEIMPITDNLLNALERQW